MISGFPPIHIHHVYIEMYVMRGANLLIRLSIFLIPGRRYWLFAILMSQGALFCYAGTVPMGLIGEK